MTVNTLKLLLSVATVGIAAATVSGAVAAPAESGPVPAIGTSQSRPALLVAEDITSIASPYTWSATKAADGTVSLEGHIPSVETRQSLTDAISKPGVDTTAVARGEPASFVADAVAALGVLATLDTGKASFDGAAWSITGAVDSADKLKAAQGAFDASLLKPLDATYHVDGPVVAEAAVAAKAAAPAAASAAATVAPVAAATPSPDYTWSAAKADDGSITFAGSVPNDKLKGFLANHVNGKAVDNSSVATGAPPTFVGGALYGLDALMQLRSGKLTFAAGKWSLSGAAKDDAAAKAATAALAAIDTKAWTFDISTAPAAVAPTAAEKPTAGGAAAAPAAAKPAATAQAPSGYAFTARKAMGGTVTLSGDVPTEGARGYFGDFAGGALTGGLSVVPNPPGDFVANTLGGLDALGKLDVGQLKLEGGKWSLQGKAPSPEIRDAVLADLAKLPAGRDFAPADIVGPTPVELCRTGLAAFVKAGGAITFDGRTTHLAKGVDAQLDKVAAALMACQTVRVDVEASTDSDGPADANMALSVARAEAVIGGLVKRGIKADRLYAVGYGETLPLVPNTTKANKAKNRRVEFKLEP